MKEDFINRIIKSISIAELDDIFSDIQVSALSVEDKAELYGMIYIMKRSVVLVEAIHFYILPLSNDNYVKTKMKKVIDAFEKGEPL